MSHLVAALRRSTPPRLRPLLGGPYRRLVRGVRFARRAAGLETMTTRGLAEALERLGIRRGVTVMVHCSMDDLHRTVPDMTPIGLIRLLQEILGTEGTLLLPTFPFQGRQLHYVETCRTFDPDRTPSRTGLVTEVFRRMPGIARSLHPTHSVAAWGRLAKELTSEHHAGGAFAETSPFHKLRSAAGIVAGIGIPVERGFTIVHVAEEVHPAARAFAFAAAAHPMTILHRGEPIPYALFPMRADVTRDVSSIKAALLGSGALSCVTRRGLALSCASAARTIDCCLDLIERGLYYLAHESLALAPGRGK